MSRRAIIIGGDVPDVAMPNIERWRQFLTSPIGGAWDDASEICVLHNRDRRYLRNVLQLVRADNIDFVILAVLAHGGYQDGQTIMEVNDRQELMGDREFMDVARKQISVFDCCRVVLPQNIPETPVLEERMFDIDARQRQLNRARTMYNGYIDNCPAQQVKMYGCQVGEESTGLYGQGGLFTNTLINAACDTVNNTPRQQYITASSVGNKASTQTALYAAMQLNRRQHPQIHFDQGAQPSLPLAINTHLWD